MKKLILLVLLIAVALYAAGQRYAIKSGKTPDGKVNIVMVDKKTGEIKTLIGK